MKSHEPSETGKFSLVLPVLFYEYLAISITRSILPGMLVASFGKWTYAMVGIVETVKGLLAFFACPLFGKISDKIGRKYCLLITVTGTTFPICVMAGTSNMWIYVICVGISGLFSATFPLTFAYIADCVDSHKRAPAYGLALATLGLSFTIGPPVGGYVDEKLGSRAVFTISFILVIIDALYIIFVLPETVRDKDEVRSSLQSPFPSSHSPPCAALLLWCADVVWNADLAKETKYCVGALAQYLGPVEDIQNIQVPRVSVSVCLSICASISVCVCVHIYIYSYISHIDMPRGDPLMKNIAQLVLVYYTSVWAVVSTLMVYVTRHLDFSPMTVGWLLSFYGISTMFSEGVLVRYIVPVLGELQSMRLGLFCFAVQAVLLAFSSSPLWIFTSVAFSMLSNLVYPSLSSLVSKVVAEEVQVSEDDFYLCIYLSVCLCTFVLSS